MVQASSPAKLRPWSELTAKMVMEVVPGWETDFIHLQCWEVLPFSTIQRQRCIKILCPKDPEFYTPLVLNCQKGRHLPALEVYKNQSPIFRTRSTTTRDRNLQFQGAVSTGGSPLDFLLFLQYLCAI